MYSSGNGTERSRITKLVQPGEVVVDMFCGIGYYSLPILVHTEVDFLCIKETKCFFMYISLKHLQAQCVVCSDWNPEALRCLKVGLKLNNIDHGRAVVLEAGDSATLHERVNKCSALCSS
jgi:tRNA G37 N-methylase Trm5